MLLCVEGGYGAVHKPPRPPLAFRDAHADSEPRVHVPQVREDVTRAGRGIGQAEQGAEEDVAATLPDRALPALRGIQVVLRGVVASHKVFGTGGRRRFPRILHPPPLARARRV